MNKIAKANQILAADRLNEVTNCSAIASYTVHGYEYMGEYLHDDAHR